MYNNWKGWPAAAESVGARPTSAWVDLSYPLRPDLPRIGYFPEASFKRIKSMPADPLNVTEIHMVCHFGTHIDAPCHFIPDGPALHEIPLDRLYGPGVVWRLRCEPYEVIEPERLVAADPPLRPGDILLLDAGWGEHFGTPRYDEHPSLSLGAAEWIVEQRVKLVGFDFMTPDIPVNRRPAEFQWPIHHILLSQGVLIAENLANLSLLAGRRVEAMFLALNIKAADGAPARVVARAV
jgi:kynurenine formamidase